MTISGQDTVSLQGVFVRAYNSSETATSAAGTTNANGRILFTLEEIDYHVYAYQAGYDFSPFPATVSVVPGGATDTIWGTAFDPGSPATAELCRVHGWVYNLSGDTLQGATVNARIVQSPLRYQNIVISPYDLSTTTDAAGHWYLDLFPSASLTPDTTLYEFTIRFASGAILRRKVAVPQASEWLLTW
jgi:beta-glucanase (GH16 family)